jgi:hypothetical protein
MRMRDRLCGSNQQVDMFCIYIACTNITKLSCPMLARVDVAGEASRWRAIRRAWRVDGDESAADESPSAANMRRVSRRTTCAAIGPALSESAASRRLRDLRGTLCAASMHQAKAVSIIYKIINFRLDRFDGNEDLKNRSLLLNCNS